MIDVQFAPLGYQQITVAGTVGSLVVPAGATMCLILAEAAIRFRDDGVNPTPTVGMPIPANNWPPFEYSGTLSALRFLPATGSTIVDISYYGARG